MKNIIYLLICLAAIGCGETDVSKIVVDPGFSSYVTAFTSGVISSQSTIKVVLVEPADAALPGEPVAEELFDFEPAIDGTAYWLDAQTIEFRPNEKLPSGQSYVAEFDLAEIMTVDNEYEEMRFGFIVVRQSLFVDFDGLRTTSNEDFSKQEIYGSLRTSDGADAVSVQQCLKALQEGEELAIDWVHIEESNTHKFTVKDVIRKADESEVELIWDGEPINADVEDDMEIEIPPLNEFSMVHVKTVQQPGVHFSIHFSDPIEPRQDLDGLIHLASNSQLRFKIDGNEIKAYPVDDLDTEETILIEETIINTNGAGLDDSYEETVQFNLETPALELLGDGVIMPSSGGASFPFKAINLKAVTLRVIRVFEHNVPQFFQVNQLNGSSELTRVGRVVANEKIDLISEEGIDYGVWNDFSIDLNNIISPEPGAIYRVILSFDRSQSLFPCPDNDDLEPLVNSEPNFDDGSEYYYNDNYWESDYYEYYDYSERENPCSNSFYRGSKSRISANLFSSDFGFIAKESAQNQFDVVITDLSSTDPLSGIEVEAYNYQNVKVGSGSTSGDGVVRLNCTGKPFLLIAKSGAQRGYLRVDNGSALSVSLFEVGGSVNKQGVKGFIYGERGVWRPGDTIFLSFILEDKQQAIPENHPVILEVFDPMGKLYDRKVKTKGLKGHYSFKLKTEAEDITGLWRAKVTVGKSEFRRSLKIETIKPNRLKIDFDFGEIISGAQSIVGKLNARWLYGSPGSSLKTRVEMSVENMKTVFDGLEGYQFDDRSRQYHESDPVVVERSTNAEGIAEMRFDWRKPMDAPGMLKMKFNTKVFESGGDFSQDYMSTKYSPYETYVGVKLAGGNNWITALNTEEDHSVAIAAVNENGDPITRTVNVELYKLNWNWWWESGSDGDRFRYIRRESSQLISSDVYKVNDGKGFYELEFPEKGYGKYLIRVVDPVSGHSSSQQFYAEYPGWWSNTSDGTEAAAMLTLETDKEKYNVDEQIEVTIPSGGIGRIYVTVEKGDKILDQFWVEAESRSTTFKLDATDEMAPNVYISAMLIQPHGQDENSLPIRMYGVIPVSVNDPDTKLEPEIRAPAEIAPEQPFTVQISEKTGKPMTYTLAVVDEGLLGLTRHKTPDPWYSFYTKEALGIRTWDMYKYVLNAQTGEMASLLAVGGDEGLQYKEDDKANRFKPVVKYLGPFYLDGGDDANHELVVSNYIGAVRVMVVSALDGAYGKDEKEIQVKQPLMVLSTLPRVLGPSERLKIPVNVISLDDKIQKVSVKVSTNDLLRPLEVTQKTVSFQKQGEQVVFFEYEVARKLGVAKFKVEVQSGSENAVEELELLVRPPNPSIVQTESQVLEPGEKWDYNYAAFGIDGTNEAVLQVSSIPDLDLEKHLKYLIRYPHGCIEQTTSSVFPQISLNALIELSSDQEDEIEANINAGLKRLRQFQTHTGGFSYWPDGSRKASAWGTNYAGHFMLEAQNSGYDLPVGILSQWKKFQKEEAANWRRARDDRYGRNGGDLIQAYRLYTLALAGEAEVGAMNRLRVEEELSNAAAWRLAAAYAIIGKKEVATELCKKGTEIAPYEKHGLSYGSRLRDMAMVLETYAYLEDYDAGFALLQDITSELDMGWHSTQTRAYCLLAISKFIGGGDLTEEVAFDVNVNGESESVESDLSINYFPITEKHLNSGNVGVKNESEQMLFVSLVQSGMPVESDDLELNEGINMNVVYKNLQNQTIDVSKLVQGQDFKAIVTVSHPGLRSSFEDVALTQIFPSGWQIVNTRVGLEDGESEGDQNFTFQDIRDDRVYTYFDLGKSRTKTFEVRLNATFTGYFYKPAVICAPMYNERIKAVSPGSWIEVSENQDGQALAQ